MNYTNDQKTIKGYEVKFITKHISGSEETNNLHYIQYFDVYDDFHKAYKVMKNAKETGNYYQVSIAPTEIYA